MTIINELKALPKLDRPTRNHEKQLDTKTIQPIVKLSSDVESDTLQERESREQLSWILSADQT